MPQLTRALALAVVAVVVSVALSACGGSSPTTTSAGTTQVTKGAPSRPTDPDGRKGPLPARSNEVVAGRSATGAGTAAAAGKAARPCALVSRSEARTILGHPVLPLVQAPQGPTCLYRYAGSQMVTLVVQSRSAHELMREVARRSPARVGQRHAFCGHQGQPTLYVPLGSRKVLSVSAPCRVAARFAARALHRMG